MACSVGSCSSSSGAVVGVACVVVAVGGFDVAVAGVWGEVSDL